MSALTVSGVRFTPAPDHLRAGGLDGWVSVLLNESLRLDGIALRRTTRGRHVLAFPFRQDGEGRPHYAARPVDDRSRRAFERQVFEHLGLDTRGDR